MRKLGWVCSVLLLSGCGGAPEPEPFFGPTSGDGTPDPGSGGNVNDNVSNGGQTLSCDGQVTAIPAFFFGEGPRVLTGTINLPSTVSAGTFGNLFIRSGFESNTISFTVPASGTSITFAWCELEARGDYEVGAAIDVDGDSDVLGPTDWEGYYPGTVSEPVGLGFGAEIDLSAGDADVTFGINVP